ncbi:MAG: archaetidylserine decarboxylase [Gammaproteobacteria bacterium]|nr:archaetidylserine decarboxylase [Gammaproteobacteria bacterium]MCH9744334.1 archaetidylserine decarboxylase [Gammaproteobacteria bacterium]
MSIGYQHILPQHLLSRMMGGLATCRCKMFKNRAIQLFINHYGVDMSLAMRQHPDEYENFNDFFTRKLKPEARPIDTQADTLISPVDGCVSEFGTIHHNRLIQAKGKDYALEQLLADEHDLIEAYQGGSFLTAYLAPKDYHRIHMPMAATLEKMIYVPGKLFSVNEQAVNDIEGLFARNERVICQFHSEQGPIAVILVGAMIVGSIATAWHGVVSPPHGKCVQQWDYPDQSISLKKGDEVGYFQMGSTVILLLPKDHITWDPALQPGQTLKMGEVIGNTSPDFTSTTN